MVYVNIPYVPENDRVDRGVLEKELTALTISDRAKEEAFESVYNKRPRGVHFDELGDALRLEGVLRRLGIPFRQSPESEYKYELMPDPYA